MSKYYRISERELIRLLARSMELACLYNDGVDNWGYYGEGFEKDRAQWAQALGLPLFTIREDGVKAYFEYDYEDIAQKRLEKEYHLIS